ncbi:MAG: TRAP transporter substrate-binding protein DctP [Bacteriovoracaceae bacterium]|nr:TRAP transporter substrate-binding protein DctP [Bacteriovoracaceae bacterium]
MKYFIAMAALGLCISANAAVLKIAALAPDGTNWAKTLKEFAKEVKSSTNGEVKVKIYYGGVAGDEPDVLRKIRVGQMHGGVFTGKTLGDIASDVRVVELPFNFLHEREKGMKALKGMASYFNQTIEKNGFVNLGFYEIGQVYVVSSKKVTSIPEMQGIKIWSWEGDKVVEAMISSLQLVSVPLALPDVLSSLSTNIIDAAYAPPLGILALQWQSQVKYLIDFPTAYSIGALLVSEKAFNKIPKQHQGKVKEIAKKYVDQANKFAVADNEEGLKILKKQGVEFIKFSEKDIARAEEIRSKVVKKLKGKVISEKAIKMLESYR